MTARYFVNRMLPQAATHLAAIKAGADDVMALTADAF